MSHDRLEPEYDLPEDYEAFYGSYDSDYDYLNWLFDYYFAYEDAVCEDY